MQPEVPNPQVPQTDLQTQNPVVQQAFQSVAPHPDSQQMLQPVDQKALKASLKPARHLTGLITTVLLSVLLVSSLGFGIWAFMSMSDYKNNSDKKSAEAVEVALADQKVKLDAEYLEKDKQPYSSYSGKPEAGSVQMQYPRTWSAYVVEQSNGNIPIKAYFHPGFVPDTLGDATSFALRLEVVDTQYAEILKQYESQVKQGGITLAPYKFVKVPDSLGSIITGKIIPGRDKVQGTMVIMPIRDKTLKIWTESNSVFLKDFNEAVLPNLTFVP
jgi:hypothetical protein